MRLCSCGEQNPDDRSYCFCGAALVPDDDPSSGGPGAVASDRAATQVLPQATVTQTGVESPSESVRQPVVLLLRRDDADRYLNPDEAPPQITVAAGGRAAVHALVRNQGAHVDNYELRIEGADPAWWTVTPGTVDLIPFGTHDGYEQEVEVQLHPPRAPVAEAGVWPLILVVHSRWTSRDVASLPLLMEIEPYGQIDVRVRPQIAAGRGDTNFIARLHNAGNAPVVVAQSAVDPGDACRFRFAAPEVELLPGRIVDSPLAVRPKRQIWLGRPQDHRFEVTARALTPEDLVQTAQATFRQRPWLPWWLAIVLPLLVIAIIALLALLGGDEPKAATVVKVPNLANAPNRLAAQQLLQDRGLTLASEQAARKHRGLKKWAISPEAKKRRQVERSAGKLVPAWAIIAQSPPPGAKVAPGTAVAVQVQGPRRMIVPRLKGLTAADAEKRLMERNLTLGEVTPEPDPKLRVVSQIPKPETLRRRGTAVDIHLAVPKKPKKKTSGKDKK
ncbi:MAG: PASTA domain-containing protein, partial [Solirubrobacteraceae bacterium]